MGAARRWLAAPRRLAARRWVTARLAAAAGPGYLAALAAATGLGCLVELSVTAAHAGEPEVRAPAAALAARRLAQAPPQVERGRAIFAARCAKCHGAEGQGGEGPRLIGPAPVLAGYPTAQHLFEFVRSDMPADAPGTLSEAEYWDVLAFVLDANGLLPPGTVLDPDTAPQVPIRR